MFDLKGGNYISCAPPKSGIYPTSIVKNLVFSVTQDGYQSFIFNIDTKEFESAYDYVDGVNPEYSQWMTDNLFMEISSGDFFNPTTEEMLVTGQMVASEDFKVVAGSWYTEENYLYVYHTFLFNLDTEEDAVEKIETSLEGIYTVYNLQGVKLLETKDLNSLKELRKGIYIVNGKKVAL